MNVANHTKQWELRSDAAALSEFLDKPVWDVGHKKFLDKSRKKLVRSILAFLIMVLAVLVYYLIARNLPQ